MCHRCFCCAVWCSIIFMPLTDLTSFDLVFIFSQCSFLFARLVQIYRAPHATADAHGEVSYLFVHSTLCLLLQKEISCDLYDQQNKKWAK